MFYLVAHIRDVAMKIMAKELPSGRGVSNKIIQDKYHAMLDVVPENEREKTIKSAIKDIEEIIKEKDIPEDIAELYPKWKVGDFVEFMKYLKGEKEVEEKKPKEPPVKDRLEPEMVRLFFMAPDNPSTKTITPEGNFQWIGYELLFKGVKDGTLKHYKYRTPLWAYGEEAEGDQSVLEYDPERKTTIESKDLSLDQVKKELERYRTVYPEGLSGFYYNVPEDLAKGKFNIDQWIKAGKKYTFRDFDRKFRKSGFYKLVSKGKKLENP